MNTEQAKKAILTIMQAKLVPFLLGSPGFGKSAIIADIAEEQGFDLIDIRLSQIEAVDLSGLPYPNEVNGTFTYFPLDLFPLKKISSKPSKPLLILLDEFNSCSEDVSAASYKLILDRMVGNYELHDNVYMVTAGNKETDGAIVNPMSSALVSRLVHIELEIDHEAWLIWARDNDISIKILGFITYQPDMLSTFDSFTKEDTLTYAVPRSWTMLSKIVDITEEISFSDVELISGIVGRKAASSFITYCKVYSTIPSHEEIIANPRGTEVFTRGDVNSAIVTTLTSVVKNGNIKPITTYINRIPMEYQTLFYQTLVDNRPMLLISSCVKSWINNNSDLFA